MTDLNLVEAVSAALAHALEHDNDVVVFGEDVGKNGGVFRATAGLQERFGERRVFDTPLAESMIAGIAVGMALQGLKPVAEFQFMGFIYPAMNQIISHAARFRNRTRGRLHCPLVFRAPFASRRACRSGRYLTPNWLSSFIPASIPSWGPLAQANCASAWNNCQR